LDPGIFMQRCLDLAGLGFPRVLPNPAVGCVIVHKEKVIGEGYHQKFGEAHAEVNAIHAVEDKSLLKESTLYVNLEPCSHYGKTPPCTELIVTSGINKVVVAGKDPSEKVNGKGIAILKKAGIEVQTGLLEKQARQLNKRFYTFHQEKRPYIILKWAQTTDGFLADSSGNSKWISNELSRQLVHKWRAEEIAILVGKNTAIVDDPALTTRDWTGDNPIRVVLDPKLEIPPDRKLFNNEAETIFINGQKSGKDGSNHFVQINFDGNVVWEAVSKLAEREIQSVLVEGGAKTLQHFIDSGLWDEARVFTGEKQFGSGMRAPQIKSNPVKEIPLQKDLLKIYKNKKYGWL